MRSNWRIGVRAAALLSGLLLLGACTLSSNPTASVSPTPTPSPSPSPPPSPTAASTPASITGIPLPTGEVGISYAGSLAASGGATPYAWTVDGGALPGGLSLTSDGKVSGVPTTPGTFAFTVKATDATNQYTTQGASIKIAAALTATLTPACATACQVEQGCVNICGIFGAQGGGVGPFQYQLLSGLIPTGNHLSGNGLNIVGTFTGVNSYWQFTVQVTDALGATATIAPTFNVYPHIKFTQTVFQCGFSGSSCIVDVPYALGNPNGQVSLHITGVGLAYFNGTPQTGSPIAYRQNAGSCLGAIPYTPTGLPPGTTTSLIVAGGVSYVRFNIPSPASQNYCSYTARVVFVLTDQSPCGSPANCTSNPALIDISI